MRPIEWHELLDTGILNSGLLYLPQLSYSTVHTSKYSIIKSEKKENANVYHFSLH